MGFLDTLFTSNVKKLAQNNDVEGLVSRIKEGNEQVKNDACKALRGMDINNIQTVDKFCFALRDQDIDVKRNASLGLGLAIGKLGVFSSSREVENSFDKMAPKVIGSLIAVLKHEESRIRSAGAVALSQLSPSYDGSAAEGLFLLLRDADNDVRASAKAALSFWAIESSIRESHEVLSDSLDELFKGTDFGSLRSQSVEPTFLAPFRGMGLNPDVEEEMGRILQAANSKYERSRQLSQSSELSSMANEFYGAMSIYFRAYLDGQDIR